MPTKSPSVFPSDAPETDVHTLVGMVAELERTQQQEDVEGFLALFDQAAVWVTGGGRRLIGLDEISAFTRQVLPGAMSDGSVTYEVELVAFIRPDVVLTGVRQQYVDLAGRPKGGLGMPSYVWSRRGETWKIVVGQNTGVAAENT